MGAFRMMLRCMLGVFLTVSMFTSVPVRAESLFLAGGNASGSDSHYAYIGSIIPLNTQLADEGFRVRLWASYLGYEYETAPGMKIDGDGPGVEAAIGYRWNFDQTYISGYGGVVYRDINLDPDDPTSDAENDDLGGKIQLEVNHTFSSQWDTSVIGSYTFAIDSYWVRVRPGYKFQDSLTIGPSVTMLGGDKYDKQKIGLFLDGMKLGNVKLGLEAGAERTAREDVVEPYGGISLSFTY